MVDYRFPCAQDVLKMNVVQKEAKMLETLVIILGFIISIIGLLGCILPVIPGPPLSYLALILLAIVKDWEPYSARVLWILAFLTLFVTVLDYIVPAAGAKKYGASRLGVLGSIVGMLLGLFFFPPWGMIFGAFIGAILGEIIAGKTSDHAFRAGWGVFVGNMVGILAKTAASLIMLFYYIKGIFY